MSVSSVLEKKEDSEGYTFWIGRYVRQNGEEITHAPEFNYIGPILDDIEKLKLKDNDIVLTSYSKAGTHWAYEILSMLINGKASPCDRYKGVDFIERSQGIEQLNEAKNFRILNTHLRPQYLPLKLLSNTKIVHIARNPKSVAVSFYHHTHKLKFYEYNGTFQSFLPTYIEGLYSIYGNWFEYMKEWWDKKQKHPNIHMMFYEDLKQDPVREISRLSQFLGHNYSIDFVSDVAKMTSFQVMKAGVGKDEEMLRARTSEWNHGEFGMIRKGTIQDWKNYFTVAQNEMFDEVYDEHMTNYSDLKSKIRFE